MPNDILSILFSQDRAPPDRKRIAKSNPPIALITVSSCIILNFSSQNEVSLTEPIYLVYHSLTTVTKHRKKLDNVRSRFFSHFSKELWSRRKSRNSFLFLCFPMPQTILTEEFEDYCHIFIPAYSLLHPEFKLPKKPCSITYKPLTNSSKKDPQ